MLETGIPKSLWRGEKMRDKLVGQFEKEKDKFMVKPDTKFQPSLDQRLPETKLFPYANKVSDFGLNDMISDKKFQFTNVNNNILLGEQLPDDRRFAFSAGIKGINDHFDSMAPNKDYRYTDPQFYEHRLQNMTQQKIVETRWRVQGEGEINPEDYDGYAKAVAFAENYKKSKLPKSDTTSPLSSANSTPVKSPSIMSAAGGGGGSNIVNPMKEMNSPFKEKNFSPTKQSPREKESPIEIQPAKRKNSLQYEETAKQNELDRLEVENSNREIRHMNKEDRSSHLLNYEMKNQNRELKDMANQDRLSEDKRQKKSSFLRWKDQVEANKSAKESPTKASPAKESPTKASPAKETSTLKDHKELAISLRTFFTEFSDEFDYIEDPENKGQLTISNGKEKVGTELAKFMRDELNIQIKSDSNKFKANSEINKLESALKTMKQSPRMGRPKGGGTKAGSKDDGMNFEKVTPHNSKNSDALRPAKSVSKGSDTRRNVRATRGATGSQEV